ncbi:MAG: hypothetical protein R3C10_26745 [Pirellulales bacterium]
MSVGSINCLDQLPGHFLNLVVATDQDVMALCVNDDLNCFIPTGEQLLQMVMDFIDVGVPQRIGAEQALILLAGLTRRRSRNYQRRVRGKRQNHHCRRRHTATPGDRRADRQQTSSLRI